METFILQNAPEASYEQLNDLLKTAFAERLDAGLNFAAAFHTTEHLKQYLADKTTFIIKDDKGYYLATMSYNTKKDKRGVKYGEFYHLAVHPSARRQGLPHQLFSLCIEGSKKEGAIYIKAHTATKAKSSTRTHIKEGFVRTKMFYNGSSGYYSYLFIKKLTPPEPLDNIRLRLGFYKSVIACRFKKRIYLINNRKKQHDI